jgi:hypothetical protein
VQQVAVKLAAGERAGLHDLPQLHGGAPAGRVRREQRMVARVHDCRLKGAGRFRPDCGRLVINRARGELDAIPHGVYPSKLEPDDTIQRLARGQGSDLLGVEDNQQRRARWTTTAEPARR